MFSPTPSFRSMFKHVVFLNLLWVIFVPAAHADDVDPIGSTVLIEAITRKPQYTEPWRRAAPESGSGTGFVIQTNFEGRTENLILTANHVVQHAASLTVDLPQQLGRHAAEVLVAAPEFDLALLRLTESDALWELEPLPIAEEPARVQQRVRVFGFPVGGNRLSVTAGIVSRTETAWTDYSRIALRMQIDAAINPGNSGGPAVSAGKVVGLAFAIRRDAQNIGYLVPSIEILRFLDDAADGTYDAPAFLNVDWQSLANDTQRRALRVPDNATGVWVSRVRPKPDGHPMQTQLQPNDVITHIGGESISDSGTVAVYPGLFGRFEVLANRFANEGRVPLTIFRDGESMIVLEPAPQRPPRLVPWLMNQTPSYYILGPLVFTPASRELYQGIGDRYKRTLGQYNSPIVTRLHDWANQGEQLVAVASPYFPHPTMQSLEDPQFNIVRTINGQNIHNLKDLVEKLESHGDPFIEIVFDDELTDTAIFDRQGLFDATEDILEDNGIRHRASPELRDLLTDE